MFLAYTDKGFYYLMNQAYRYCTPVYVTNNNAYIIADNKKMIVKADCITGENNFLYKIKPSMIDTTNGELYKLNDSIIYIGYTKLTTQLKILSLDLEPEQIALTKIKNNNKSFLISQGVFTKLSAVFYTDPVTITLENDKLIAKSNTAELKLEKESLNLHSKPITFNITLNEINFIKEYGTEMSINKMEASLNNNILKLTLPHKTTIIELSH